jgi:hypothetical protein
MAFYARLTTAHASPSGHTLEEELEVHPDGRLLRSTGGGGGSGRRSATLSTAALAHLRAAVSASGVLSPAVSDAAWPRPDGRANLCELEVVDGEARAHVSFATTRDAGFGSAAAVSASADPAGLGAFTAAVADFRAFALAALHAHTAPPAGGAAGGAGGRRG